MNNSNIKIWEMQIPIGASKYRVVPFLDLAQINTCQGFGRERDVTERSRKVDDRHDRTDDGW